MEDFVHVAVEEKVRLFILNVTFECQIARNSQASCVFSQYSRYFLDNAHRTWPSLDAVCELPKVQGCHSTDCC